MSEERVKRKLSAILSADVVGYSRMMQGGSAPLLRTLNALYRDEITPTIHASNGRVVKLLGDGALVEFQSAGNALAAAIALRYPNGMHSWAVTMLCAVAALVGTTRAQVAGVERAVERAEAMGVRTGVAVCDEDANILYRHRAGEAFAPASNMKLLTAAGVLSGLGRDHEFVTEFEVMQGALSVRASGDPNWIAGSGSDPERVFGALGAALLHRGVRAVRDVKLAPGVFTGPARPETWPKDQLYAYYCAPTGPFVLQQGTFVVGIERRGGPTARVELVAPPAGYPIRGSIREVASRKGATYGAIDEGDAVKVRGKFYRKSPRVEIKTSVNDPSRWYQDTLRHQLSRAGVAVTSAAPAADLGVVFRHRSPLLPALRRMLEDSSNFDAEQCLRALGAATEQDGSLAGGRKALRAALIELVGRVPEGVELVDGSSWSDPSPRVVVTQARPFEAELYMVEKSSGEIGKGAASVMPRPARTHQPVKPGA